MAENSPNPEPSEENLPTPIDRDKAAEAIKEVDEAMAILPKKRFGCFRRFAKTGAVLLLLLAVFVYWNFLRTPRLRISKETTYITEPLTSDGQRVDYFAAWEETFYPPEMKTDDNGYRMIVRALGEAEDQRYDSEGNEIDLNTKARSVQIYEKLGLDPTIEPTLDFIEAYGFLREYAASEGLDEKQTDELNAKVYRPWTLDETPMMEPWLEQNGPVLELVGEAVRRPAFCFPLVWDDDEEEETLVGIITLGEAQRIRSFARMLQTRANYRIGIGDVDGAIDDVITCVRLGRHVQHGETMVSRLIGIAVEGMAASLGVAAVRESQPSEEQLRRFVDELDAIGPRPNIDRTILTERFYMLDLLQTMAHGEGSLAELFSDGVGMEASKPGIAASLTVDWNIIMRRMNTYFDNLDKTEVVILYPPKRLLLGNLFIGVRSQHVADYMAILFLPSMQAVREADRRTYCLDNFHRITLAMLLYELENGSLPPAYTVDAGGNPLHSWRVLLLPYLGEEELYAKIHLDEPWDSQHNRGFHDTPLAIYQCPSAELEPGQSTYSVVVGENMPFQAGEGKSLDDFGMNLILVVERRQPVGWMEPASEVAESLAMEGINRQDEEAGIGSPHPGGMNVGLRDGSTRFISETIAPSSLRGLLDGTAEEEWRY